MTHGWFTQRTGPHRILYICRELMTGGADSCYIVDFYSTLLNTSTNNM